jgi:hypothetical protein
MPTAIATPRILRGLSKIFSRTLKGKTAEKCSRNLDKNAFTAKKASINWG